MQSNERALNAEQAAGILGAHVETVRRLARRGELPAFKVGKDWRFRRQTLESWMAGQSHSTDRVRVLLIDDDPLIGTTLRAYFAADKYDLDVQETGESGLLAVAEFRPNVVILDLKLPDLTGAQVLEQIRRRHADLPVILLTGFPDSALVVDAILHSPAVVLAKPATHAQVTHAVRMAIGEPA